MSKIESTTIGNILNIFSNDFYISDFFLMSTFSYILPNIETLIFNMLILSMTFIYFIPIGFILVLILFFLQVVLSKNQQK